MESPRQAYEQRLADRQQTLAHLQRRDLLIANLRLAAFLAAVALAALAWRFEGVSAAWLGLPVAIFVALVVWHDAVLRLKDRAARAVAYYQRGLARLADAWAGTGNRRTDLAPEDHLYAADLDLFGHGSLFELLSCARTQAGEETLAGWLCAPASRAQVLARQAAVAELRDRLDLREALAMLGGDVRAAVHPATLVAWSEAPARFVRPGLVRLGAAVIVGVVVATGGLWATGVVGPGSIFLALVCEWAFHRVLRDRVAKVTAGIQQPEEELAVLAAVLQRLEREPTACPYLVELRQRLAAEGSLASVSIARLERLISWLNSRNNQFFAPVAYLLLWHVHFTLAIEAWRTQQRRHIARWLAAVGEWEALSDLSAFAFERPDNPFPEITAEGPCFDGHGLGHPLLPAGMVVRNDVRLGADRTVLLVSGSNMSGKTTLLRTVGVNTVLALCGAPVRAARLRISVLQVGATLRIHDSIQEGTSRFYAELKRLHDLQRVGREEPVLFLLDELLHGTNSHDRRVGAEAVVRAFVAQGGIGLVTTHDLALTDIVEEFEGRAANIHFADELVGDALRFDYRIRPGVVQRSNALALMRSLGLGGV